MALLAASVVLVAAWIWTMATMSLWNDEIFTILNFSSKGPATVTTDYHAANNHVFFNFLNSVLPGRASVEPLRARLLSFLAVVASLFVLYADLRRRGLAFGGALVVFLVAANRDLLELALQARGYGLLLLAASLSAVALGRFLSAGSNAALLTLLAAIVLGSYTVPTFVAWGGALLAVTFLARPTKKLFVSAAAAGLTVLALYAPIAAQVWLEARQFDSTWGREYGSVLSIGETLRRYVLPQLPDGPDLPRGLTLGLLVALAVWLSFGKWRNPTGDRLLGRVLLGSTLLFFTVCVVQGTPAIRTTSFVAPPLLLAAVLGLGRGASGEHGGRLRGWLCVPVAVAALCLLARPVSPSAIVPFEEWRGVARFVDATFPRGMPVHCRWAWPYLEPHLKGGGVEARRFEPGRFASGSLVLLDNSLTRSGRIAERQTLPVSAVIRFAERRAESPVELRFAPPVERNIVSLETEEGERPPVASRDAGLATGWDLAQGGSGSARWLVVSLDPGREMRSVVLLFGGRGPAAVRAWIVRDDGWAFVPNRDVGTSGGLVVLHLGGRRVSEVHVRIEPSAGGAELLATWAYPAR